MQNGFNSQQKILLIIKKRHEYLDNSLIITTFAKA